VGVPTNLIPTPITGLPEYQGSSTLGYLPYVLEGRSYKVQFANIAAVGAVPSSRVIAAGTGLAGGGDLSANRVISIANGGVGFDQLALSGVVAGTYGSGSAIPILTVDAKGRVTSATTAALDVTGFVPTSRTITAGDGLTGGGSLANNITLTANFSVVSPSALGVASPGTAVTLSRGDHVHPAVNLSDTTQTQGALPLGRGGTGDALSPVAGAVVYSTGSKFALTNPGIAGQVLVSAGTDEPQWRTVEGAGTVTSVNLTAGTGISVSGGPITVSGSINVVNTAPDQIVSLTGAGTTTISGTYPNFTITSNDSTVGTVTSVAASGGTTGLTFSGSPITSSGTLTLGGTLAVANGGTGASVAGTARTNLGAAASGANTDITSIALTTGTISASPVNGTDIVNKLYADSIASGINFHQSVRLATVTALPANTYNNGTSGVGATLTANANGALSVDGVAVVAGNRILVKNEAAGANNGVYTVTQVGSGAAPYILTRATDFDSAGTGVDQIDAGDFFLVTAGSTQANTSWVQQTPLPITVGTTAIVFSQFAAPVLYSAGTGLTLAGTVFSITNTGVSASTYGSASSVPVLAINAQGQVTSASASSIAINASQITSGTVTVGQGGTGATTLGANGVLLGNGTSAISATAVGTTGQVLVGNTGAAPTWATLTGIGVTSFSAGTTGLTPSSATTGAITLAGTLNVANGGTGATSLASGYLVKGNGTSAASASVVYDNGTNVGIGTTSPVSKLDVNGEVSVKGQIFLANDGTSNYIRTGSTGLFIQNSTGASTFATITNTGNVGIGITTPTAKVQIGTVTTSFGASEVNLALTGANGFFNSSLLFASENTNFRYQNKFFVDTGALVWQNSTDGTNYTERMRITSVGNLGLGVSPTVISNYAVFDIKGRDTGQSAIINFFDGAGTQTGLVQSDTNYGFLAGASGSRPFAVFTNGSERMRINASGNVGIGTTSQTIRLQVTDVDQATARIGVQNLNGQNYHLVAGTPGASNTGFAIFDATASATRMYIDSSGNVGIGITSPVAYAGYGNLTINGTTGGTLTLRNTANTNSSEMAATASEVYLKSVAATPLTFGTNNAERMRIISDGRVLVGTSTSPNGTAVSLTLARAGDNGLNLAYNSGGGGGASMGTITGAGLAFYTYTGVVGSESYTERMRIDASGNLMLGTTSSSSPFTVQRASSDSAEIKLNQTGTSGRDYRISSTGTGYGSAGNLIFYDATAAAERMRIDASGNVGIGTSSPTAKLTTYYAGLYNANTTRFVDVTGDFAGTNPEVVSNAGAFTGLRMGTIANGKYAMMGAVSEDPVGYSRVTGLAFWTSNFDSAPLERMRINGAGQVGIGTTTPSATLHVVGTSFFASDMFTYQNGGIFFSGNSSYNVGIFSRTADLVFQANGSERMRLTSAGNLLINESAQVAYGGNTPKLEVLSASIPSSDADGGSLALIGSTNTAGAGGALVFGSLFQTGAWGTFGRVRGSKDNSTAGNFGGGIAFDTRANGSNFAQRMLLDSSGNLGVGTDAPAVRLSVLTGSNYAATFNTTTIPSSSTAISIGGYTTAGGGGGGSVAVRGYHNHGATAGSSMAFEVNGSTEVMRIDGGTLNVGIGTSAPAAKLQVIGSVFSQIAVDGSNASGVRLVPAGSGEQFVRFVTSDGSNRAAISGQDDGGGPGSLRFYTANSLAAMTQRMLITSGGNVLVNIGTVVQGGRFGVADTSNAVCVGMYASGTGNTTGTYLNCGDDNNIKFRVFTNGDVQNTNNSYGAISDIKVKDNIEDATPKLQNLMQVRVVNYNLKTQPEQKHIGVVAQELEEIFPSLVEETADRDAEGELTGETTKSVKYSVFVPMLIKALQEANEKIDTLAARVAQLEGK
jgi:hypothetical protein